MGVLASDVRAASSLATQSLVLFYLFAGLFINVSAIPVYFIWIRYISWFYYTYESIQITIWSDVGNIPCNNSTQCRYPTGQSVIDSFSFDKV